VSVWGGAGPSLWAEKPELVGDPNSKENIKLQGLRKALQLQRRVFTSVALGAFTTCWIFSGTWAFALVAVAVGIRALLEYYSMAASANNSSPVPPRPRTPAPPRPGAKARRV
jgi:hypothetical protein